jgi:hypothetical protein
MIENETKVTVKNMLNQKLEYSFDGERHVFLPYEAQSVSSQFCSCLPKKYFLVIGGIQ